MSMEFTDPPETEAAVRRNRPLELVQRPAEGSGLREGHFAARRAGGCGALRGDGARATKLLPGEDAQSVPAWHGRPAILSNRINAL
jgi:hypothetical protein